MQSAFFDTFQSNGYGKSKRIRSQSFMQGNSVNHPKSRVNNQKSYYYKNYPIKQTYEPYSRSRYMIDDYTNRERTHKRQKYEVRYDSEPKIKNSPQSGRKRRNSGNLYSKNDSPIDGAAKNVKQLDGFKIVQNGNVILDKAKTSVEFYQQALSNAKLYSEIFASSVMITGPKMEQISLPNFYLVGEARS